MYGSCLPSPPESSNIFSLRSTTYLLSALFIHQQPLWLPCCSLSTPGTTPLPKCSCLDIRKACSLLDCRVLFCQRSFYPTLGKSINPFSSLLLCISLAMTLYVTTYFSLKKIKKNKIYPSRHGQSNSYGLKFCLLIIRRTKISSRPLYV
jgi:hypothetical protein